VIYLDTSAVVKLVRSEDFSEDLVGWLNKRSDRPLVSSALVEIELPRALRRSAPEALPGVPGVLARLYRLEIDQTVRSVAANYPDSGLRSLDAIHLATAQHLINQAGEDFEALVAYDDRLLLSANGVGIPTASPGRT
jgi:uncharacterized protein